MPEKPTDTEVLVDLAGIDVDTLLHHAGMIEEGDPELDVLIRVANAAKALRDGGRP